MTLLSDLTWKDLFAHRHIGPGEAEVKKMLNELGYDHMEAFIAATVPPKLRRAKPLQLAEAASEAEALAELRALANQNKLYKSWLGMGYSGCITPAVIQRNLLENPGWYTQYTPYQPEISQGRLESLLNFQTLISDLCGLPIANASLLDESTGAAEAMALSSAVNKRDDSAYLLSSLCHPQTIAVVQQRAKALGISVLCMDHREFCFDKAIFGALLPYPHSTGGLQDYRAFIKRCHEHQALVTLVADLLALCVLVPPGELGADIAVGSSQRFGVPLGYGGPHAGFFATKEEFKRLVPGRMVGLSRDAEGNPALRLALQTREQHIRREKATSNICTAQALLANVAAMYAVYHGEAGLKAIARRVHSLAAVLAKGLEELGYHLAEQSFFDTVCVRLDETRAGQLSAEQIWQRAQACQVNLRLLPKQGIAIALDETTCPADLNQLWEIFNPEGNKTLPSWQRLASQTEMRIPKVLQRQSAFLQHENFRLYHSETELMRYLKRLENRDLSLTTSMIPLGSCTMKLNAACELQPISWPEFNQLHPFVPREQASGYQQMTQQLEVMLADITGFDAVSLQPNSGAQGEYAGLLVIKAYHADRGEAFRNICLIPTSAHGTNPASASLAGLQVVPVRCDIEGNIDIADLQAKAQAHRSNLAAMMITYPSTHGVFEEAIREVCQLVHQHGACVYLDGANLNAQLGLCAPGDFGADVCHINLHKTFAIPHGGGGPGMGPIAVKAHLAPYLPSHPVVPCGGSKAIGPVSAAPWGSASILPIAWMYVRLLGAEGLTRATEVAILNANYIAKKLSVSYPVLYKGRDGHVAHECIIDMRPFKQSAGIEVVDIAKRLMDYGFHAPTMAFPVAGTLMIEPTESETLAELDRFCSAMLAIRAEIAEIEQGKMVRDQSPLKKAPHTLQQISADSWNRAYSRQVAAFPSADSRRAKYWPAVARIDEAYGDRNFICTCPSWEGEG